MEREMLEDFKQRRVEIEDYLQTLLHRKELEFGRINSMGKDLSQRLLSFASGGKMIRGLLVSLGYSIFMGEEGPAAVESLIQAGAVMELFQSGLLIHDDIMDRDTKRRGMDTLFYQYAGMSGIKTSGDAYHIGESLGICAGDVAFFLAFEILSTLEVRNDIYRKIMGLTSKEMGYVGIAQMQDVFNGSGVGSVSEDDILRLYVYKTGRYTFSLPLMIGGLLADCGPGTIRMLESLGESLGVIFQLKDDEIGIYGKQDLTGKPQGSDIKEGKKTLSYEYLRKLATPAENRKIDSIFGNREIGEEEIIFIQSLSETLGVRKRIALKIDEKVNEARTLIEEIPGTIEKYKGSLNNVLEASLKRVS
jgi:geranylgeranyl diphosphate synthase, type I